MGPFTNDVIHRGVGYFQKKVERRGKDIWVFNKSDVI